MPLEAVVLCLDNSEWMRNGDYLPTRMQNQAESAVRITSTVVNGNAESSLGMLSMAGDNVQLLASPTRETDKLVASLKKVQLGGQAQFYKSLCVAQIALKYVKNPNGSKRIIAFVGSPLQETAEKLTKLAQYLRMQQIRVDVICLGEIEGNREKLTSFVQTNSREGHQSHLVEVPRGVALMEAIFASPIFGGAGGAAGGGFGGAVGVGGGADDDMGDAELQMAMRMSAEEARNSAQQGQGVASGNIPAPASTTNTGGGVGGGGDFGDEDPELMMALQMSMMDTGVANVSIQSTSPTPTIEQSLSGGAMSSPGSIEDEDDDAAALALALAMSQEQPSSSSSDSSSSGGGNNTSSNSNSNSSKSDEAASAVGSSDIDPEYLAQLLKNVDVDPNDLLIQSTGLFDGKPKESKDKDDKDGGSSDGGAGSNKRSQPEK